MTVNGHKLNVPRFEMGENARMAFRTLREHKTRSFLTVLGVVIGVTALIAVGSIVVGLDKDVRSFLEDFGTNTLFVFRWDIGFSSGRRTAEERWLTFIRGGVARSPASRPPGSSLTSWPCS